MPQHKCYLPLIMLLSVTSLQSAGLRKIRAVKDFSPLTPVTVTLKQVNTKPSSSTFKRNNDNVKQLEYADRQQPITIEAKTTIDGKEKICLFDLSSDRNLIGREILIKKDPTGQTCAIELKPIAPKKQPIKVVIKQQYNPTNLPKPNSTYTVQITDSTGKETIAKKQLKNLTTELSFRLNEQKEKGDLARYNINKVNLTTKSPGRLSTASIDIGIGQIEPGYTINIVDEAVTLVNKAGKIIIFSENLPKQYKPTQP
jgi:hypothetical protein